DQGVRGSRNGDADRVEIARQVRERAQGGNAVARGDGGGAFGVGVHHRDEVGLLESGVDSRVVLAETADADHGDTDRAAAGSPHEAARQRITPRRLSRMKAASLPTSGWDGNSA